MTVDEEMEDVGINNASNIVNTANNAQNNRYSIDHPQGI